MTKCSALPRAFGIRPAGSAVRVKSRLALYSASGAEDPAFDLEDDLLAGLALAAFFAPALVRGADFGFAPFDDDRLVAVFARLADFRPVARFEPAFGLVR